MTDLTPPTVSLATHAMGTRFELRLAGRDGSSLRAAGEEAIERIEDAHRRLSRFERGSVVYEINASAGARAVRVDDEVFDLLQRCEQYREDSAGAFDILSSPGPLGGASGRGGPASVFSDPGSRQDSPSDSRRSPPPPSVTGEERDTRPLLLDATRRTVSMSPPGHTIDLGGVAKGTAIDLAVGSLRDAGIPAGLVHGGSSTFSAFGDAPDGGPWRVRLGTETHAPVVELRDRALSTSSQHGDRPGHIVEPGTGRPAEAASYVACLGGSAEQTDAWATALVVLGGRPSTMPAPLTSVIRLTVPGDAPAWRVDGPAKHLVRLPTTRDGDLT